MIGDRRQSNAHGAARKAGAIGDYADVHTPERDTPRTTAPERRTFATFNPESAAHFLNPSAVKFAPRRPAPRELETLRRPRSAEDLPRGGREAATWGRRARAGEAIFARATEAAAARVI